MLVHVHCACVYVHVCMTLSASACLSVLVCARVCAHGRRSVAPRGPFLAQHSECPGVHPPGITSVRRAVPRVEVTKVYHLLQKSPCWGRGSKSWGSVDTDPNQPCSLPTMRWRPQATPLVSGALCYCSSDPSNCSEPLPHPLSTSPVASPRHGRAQPPRCSASLVLPLSSSSPSSEPELPNKILPWLPVIHGLFRSEHRCPLFQKALPDYVSLPS